MKSLKSSLLPLLCGVLVAPHAAAQAAASGGVDVSAAGASADTSTAAAAPAADAPAADATVDATAPAVDATATPTVDATLAPEPVAAPAAAPAREPYMKRYRPKNNLVEIGVFGGMMFPSDDHGLFDERREHVPYADVAGEIGLRLAYFPLSFLGVEIEGAGLPAGTDPGKAGLWTARAHGVLQLPSASIVPFLLLGGGVLGASSDAMGSDRDASTHFGGGVKIPFDDFLSLRVDLRDTLIPKYAEEAQVHNAELLFGLSFTFDRHPAKKPAGDKDGDGVLDDTDSCPDAAGPAPTGCPPPPDQDCDGVPDADDRCPEEHGKDGAGCPVPPACPACEAPNPDPDGDGIIAPADKCPTAAETKNGFQDADGCPDEIPEEVKKFTGTMEGITFEFASAVIAPASYPVLDGAAKTLVDYPDLRVLITGHTDNVGARDTNVKLSERRAESVKTYLVGKGVAADRIETRGAGPDEPVADNATPAGRTQNRRIEFKILMK